MADDELFVLRNLFHTGNYQKVITDGTNASPSTELGRIERDIYIAQGNPQLVVSEVPDAGPASLLAVKTFASLLADPSSTDVVLATALSWAEDPVAGADPYVKLMTGMIHQHLGNLEDALRAVHGINHLECMAFTVQVLLTMRRLDLAEKHVSKMQALDDDATLTSLAQAWFAVQLGGPRAKDAFYIFQEQADKYGKSVAMLNGTASALMALLEWDNAEAVLTEAQSMTPNDPDTLINLSVVMQHTGKADRVPRILAQLRAAAPKHPFVEQADGVDAAFTAAAAQFNPSVSA